VPNAYRSWNITDPLDRPGGVARDERGMVQHPTKTEWYLVRTSDKNAKSCSVSSLDGFDRAFPQADSDSRIDIQRAFARFPNLIVKCYIGSR
jgi:hypothetical protein